MSETYRREESEDEVAKLVTAFSRFPPRHPVFIIWAYVCMCVCVATVNQSRVVFAETEMWILILSGYVFIFFFFAIAAQWYHPILSFRFFRSSFSLTAVIYTLRLCRLFFFLWDDASTVVSVIARVSIFRSTFHNIIQLWYLVVYRCLLSTLSVCVAIRMLENENEMEKIRIRIVCKYIYYYCYRSEQHIYMCARARIFV